MDEATDEIDTVEALVAKLGGSAKTAEVLQERKGNVDAWKHRAQIPPKYYTAHTTILSDLGIVASPTLWGQKVIDLSPLRQAS